jgi:uncharacterized protein DUF5615
LKLLLDEMYPSSIASGLRARDHDAVAVVERPDLRTLADADLFAAAQSEQRTVVTENVRDFAPIANDFDARGTAHYGLVLVHPGAYPRGNPRVVGAMVTALDALARRYAGSDALSLREWL